MRNILVLFGGKSSEHEVSCISVVTVVTAIDRKKYDVTLIGITKEGQWLLIDDIEAIKNGSWINSTKQAILSPDRIAKEIIINDEGIMKTKKIDVVFPVLHGLNGEDGTVQGLFTLADIPYVGCGVLASAVSMDKLYTKVIVDDLGINQARYVKILDEDLKDMDSAVNKVLETLSLPVFIKPSNAGSSRGVSKAHTVEELKAGLLEAAKHDRKLLVEETIIGRELECGVLGAYDVEASGVGEVLSAADFYDYDAKYNNAESKTVIGPNLPEGKEDEIRDAARKIFMAVDGFGVARIDFFLEKDTNRVVFNELNTLPGFTSISMYPMLWEAKGISKVELVDKLIELAYER